MFPSRSNLGRLYKVLIDGTNCWANLDGACRRLGFVTTRVVEALDPDQAEAVALAKLKEELRPILLNKPEDIPHYTITEIYEVDEKTATGISRAGCTWYPDDYIPSS